MADVRSMLRQERAARQQNGKAVKVSAAPALAPSGKKRKAPDDDLGERKRTKAEEAKGLPASFFDGDLGKAGEVQDASLQDTQAAHGKEGAPADVQKQPADATLLTEASSSLPAGFFNASAQQQPTTTDTVDEEEWAAFERDVATPPPERHTVPALNASATIEVAPISAAEVAAQARDDQNTQRGRRDAEIEAEKEDAARYLEEEFDEMEELEARVRKLREKREALRQSREQEKMDDVVEGAPQPQDDSAEDESDDDYDEDEWDSWRFRAP